MEHEKKPEWFSAHEKDDDRRFGELTSLTKEINAKVPSKELIDQSFASIHEKLNAQNKVADTTLAEVKRTNGRVTKQEAWQKGILMCLGLIVIVIIPLAVYAYNLGQENLRNQILNEIKK